MDTILVTQDKSTEEFVSEAKQKTQVAVKGRGRETVTAVDVAEELKIEGFRVKSITISTEEEEINEKKIRTSVIIIELEK